MHDAGQPSGQTREACGLCAYNPWYNTQHVTCSNLRYVVLQQYATQYRQRFATARVGRLRRSAEREAARAEPLKAITRPRLYLLRTKTKTCRCTCRNPYLVPHRPDYVRRFTDVLPVRRERQSFHLRPEDCSTADEGGSVL